MRSLGQVSVAASGPRTRSTGERLGATYPTPARLGTRPWSRKITKRRFDPNIQRVRAKVNGTSKRLNVCTGCLKAGKVSR